MLTIFLNFNKLLRSMRTLPHRLCGVGAVYYFFFFFFRDFPALFIAMAMLCFSGYPECLSSLMFSEITFLLLPFASGIFLSYDFGLIPIGSSAVRVSSGISFGFALELPKTRQYVQLPNDKNSVIVIIRIIHFGESFKISLHIENAMY